MTIGPMKIAIVGAGGVGASVAYNLLLTRRGDSIFLLDSRPELIASHVMDLEQTLELEPGSSIAGGAEADLLDADVVVMTASAPLTVNTSRLAYLDDNARIVTAITDLLPSDWPGILLVVTNPVDPLVTLVQQRTGLDRRRVLGYTLNDNLRLRTGIGRALGVAPGSVEAWVVGEHGDASVPLFDSVRVDGEPAELSPAQRAEAEEFLRGWYVRHVALDSGRSSTWTSGLGIARMIAAIAAGDAEVWPASVVLEGEYGIDGIAVSVPVSLRPRGVERILEWTLSLSDLESLRAAAGAVREAIRGR